MGSPPEGFLDLVRKAQEGDRAAMDKVLDVLRPHLEPMARPFVDPARPVESTSDLLQESCLRAWQKIGTFDGAENDEETFLMFRAWIGQIVRSLGLTAKRDRQRLKRSPPNKVLRLTPWDSSETDPSGAKLEPLSADPSPSGVARSDERIQRVQAFLRELPDRTDAAIVEMYCVQGKSLLEVSRQLEISYDRVRSRYQTTMLRMERELKGLI